MDLLGADDEQRLSFAHSEGRIIFTHDTDFLRFMRGGHTARRHGVLSHPIADDRTDGPPVGGTFIKVQIRGNARQNRILVNHRSTRLFDYGCSSTTMLLYSSSVPLARSTSTRAML
ncbi:MAG TPA: hypothetical protein VNT79_13435 [Phycisphaerae bacterium]|nr:hypothetical protein [Phycisphaerae bacterium]